MSKEVLNAVIYKSNAGRTLATRMALFLMAEAADTDGYGFAGPVHISDNASGHKAYDIKTARTALDTLNEDGEIILWKYRPRSRLKRKSHKYEWIITVGQSNKSIYNALLTLNQTPEQALATIEGLAKGETQFFLRKNGPETQKTGDRPTQNGRQTRVNGRQTRKTGDRPAHPDPSVIRQFDPSVLDPSERELSLSKLKNLSQTTTTKTNDLTANGSEPPPNSAPPPPDDFKLMAAAVCKACGKKGKPSSRDRGVAWKLLEAGYTSEQVVLLAPDGAWFQEGRSHRSKARLHRSNLLDVIDQCLAWHSDKSPDKPIESAEPTEAPTPGVSQMIEAMSKATGKQIKNSPRNRQEAGKLLAKYTPEQIALLAPDGAWFQAVKPFGTNSNPLHYSQLAEFMPQCLAWHKNPTLPEITEAKVSEYTFDGYSDEELELHPQNDELTGSAAMSTEALEDLRRRLGL